MFHLLVTFIVVFVVVGRCTVSPLWIRSTEECVHISCPCLCVSARGRETANTKERVRENQLLIVSCFSFGFVFVSLTASSYYSLLDASVDVASSRTFGCPLFLFASFLHSRWFRSFVRSNILHFRLHFRAILYLFRSLPKCLFVCLSVCIMYIFAWAHWLLVHIHARSLLLTLFMFECSYDRALRTRTHVWAMWLCARPCYGLRGSELTT